MSKNKTFILANLLSQDEADELVRDLDEGKKERQSLLLQTLRKFSDYKSSRSSIFLTVYSDDYSKEKDYLLRNDLRKLTNVIKSFIQREIAKTSKSIDYYQILHKRKAYALFEKEIVKTIEQLKKTQHESLYEHQKKYCEFILRYKPRVESDLKKQRILFLDIISQTPDDEAYFKSYFILLLAVLERITWQYFSAELSDLSLLHSFDSKASGLVKYNLEKAKSYQVFGIDRIEQLNNCMAFLKVSSKQKEELKKEASYLESQLGLEYYLLPDFDKSLKHYEKAYLNFDLLDNSQKIQLIYNYSSMRCASNDDAEVIRLLGKHIDIFDKTPYIHNVSLFLLMAHINTNQIANLRNLLPDQNASEELTKDAQLYWRVLECIVLYYENSYELLITYLENIYNTSRYNRFVDKAFVEFSKIFQRFLNAKIVLDKEDKFTKLEACKLASDDFISAYKLGFGSNMLCSIWLNKEVERAIVEIGQ